MLLTTRLKRAAKELLALRQWPRFEPPLPKTYEEQIYACLVEVGDICLDVGSMGGEVCSNLVRNQRC